MARRLAKWCSYRRDEAGALRRAVRAAVASRCGGPSGGWVYPGGKARCKAAPACGQWPQRGRQLRGVVGLRAAGVSGWESPVQGRARSRAVAAARASTSRCGGVSGVDNLLLLWYTDNAPTREAAVAACQKGRPSGPPLFLLLARLVVGFAPLRSLPCAARLPPRCAPAPWGGRGVGHGLALLRSAPYAGMFALPRMGACVAGKKAP